jgi:hypothetical protein
VQLLGSLMQTRSGPESLRLLDKLVREITRAELQAIDHPVRERRRLGDSPPVQALRDVALHAGAMQPRFETLLRGHDVALHRGGLGATLATLRHLVVERVIDAERAYRTALLDLRHGIDVVKLLRDVARREMLFGVIRWCDDWLGARRTLVARVEAQLAWFAEDAEVAIGISPAPVEASPADLEAQAFEARSTPSERDLQ